jgi:hypothetical protein
LALFWITPLLTVAGLAAIAAGMAVHLVGRRSVPAVAG